GLPPRRAERRPRRRAAAPCGLARWRGMSDAARRKVSACVITRNEAANLPDCLAALRFADEIVVVDSLSDDGTAELAERLGARVIRQEFLGHVRQKQLAVDAARHDWVLCVDAD